MRYLLDTNAISDLMEGRRNVIDRVDAVSSADAVVTCAIVLGEIRFGIERLPPGQRRDKYAAKAAEVFSGIPCEGVTVAAADHYARIKAERSRAGAPMNDNDLWIAATARALDAVLVTRDRDLDGIDGLTVQDWSV